jgi:ABC-type glycerol-3-phosphate transport system permease component
MTTTTLIHTVTGRASEFLSRKSVHRFLGHLVVLLLLLGIVIGSLLPLAYMLSTSLKPTGTETEFPIRWIPERIMWRNYAQAFTLVPTLTFLKNTVAIACVSLLGELLTSSLAAYGFSRLRFPGRELLFTLMLSTLMLQYIVTVIPLFILYRNLGWIDTLYPFTVPAFFGGRPIFIFLLRQYFMGLPVELDDAAKIDGAGFFRIWWSVLMPLAKPVLGTVAILSLIHNWNDFTGPMIFLNSIEKYTLALGTRMFRDEYSLSLNLTMAYSTMMTVPIVTVFFLFQKYMVRGISMTGLTGR